MEFRSPRLDTPNETTGWSEHLGGGPRPLAGSPRTIPQFPFRRARTHRETRRATTTVTGTTGLWFLPTAEVLPGKKWSASFYRTNIDDGQGFSDVSTFPATVAVGLGGRAELFGSWALVDAHRPRYAPALLHLRSVGPGHRDRRWHPRGLPAVRKGWIGSKLGDLESAARSISCQLEEALRRRGAAHWSNCPSATKMRARRAARPTSRSTASCRGYNRVVEVSGTAGVIVRGNPDGLQTDERPALGCWRGVPDRHSGLRVTAELFGENYFDKVITAPAGHLATTAPSCPSRRRSRIPSWCRSG